MAALKLSAEFSEDDHPRDKDGKFAPAANGGGAAERQAKYSTVPDRAFVATVTNHDGSSVTKTVYGKHPSDAENRHLAENKDAKRVVVRSELRETDPGYKKPGFMDRVKGAVAKVKEALKSDPSGGWDAYEQEKAARAAAGVHEPSADYGQDDDEGSHRNRGDSRPLGGLKIGMLSHDAVEGRNLLAWMGFDLFDWNEEDHPRGAGGKFATGDDASKHASIMDKVRGIIAQHREKVAAREADDAKYAAAAHKEEISATASKIYWAHKNAAEKDGYAQHIKSAETAAGRALTSDEKKKVMMDADDAMRTMARKTAETIDKATYGDNGEKYKAPKADFVLKADTWKNASWR